MRCNHLIRITALQYKACCSPNDYYIATYKMSYYLLQICASVFDDNLNYTRYCCYVNTLNNIL